MNLQELSSALPKQWLSISAHELNADLANVEYVSINQISAQDIECKTITSDVVSGPTNARNTDNILSSSDNGVSGRIPTFSGTAKVLQDSGTLLSSLATNATLTNYLLLAGGTMTGSINMGAQAITNASSITSNTVSGPTNSRATDNILSSSDNGVSGRLPTFSGTAKVLQDSGTLLSSLATNASLINYLQLAGGTMTGSINMGTQAITNASSIDSASNMNIGTSSATGVTIAKNTTSTVIAGKGYVSSTRPIMSGGFTMLTPVTYNLSSAETVIIGAGLGSLTTLANTIALGQSSHSVASGSLGINLSPTLTLRLKGGPTSATVLATMAIPLSTITAGSAWKLTSDYTVKAIGGAGVAQMYINSVFVVYDTVNPPTYAFFTLNTTTFDTTVNNVITLTAQWSVASSTNTITCQQFTTNSVYTP